MLHLQIKFGCNWTFQQNYTNFTFATYLDLRNVPEYWNISGELALPKNMIFTLFRQCLCYPKFVQFSCTSI